MNCPETMRPHVEKVLNGEYKPNDAVDLSGITRVLDIGANVGAFSLWAREQWPNAEIVAVEPVRATFDLLEKNVSHLSGVTTKQVAVRSGNGGDRMMMGGMNNCGECSFHDLGEQERTVGLKAFCLQPFQPEFAGFEFIKIDTEGCELEILEGGLDLSCAQIVALEWHREEDVAPIEKILTDAGLVITDKRQTTSNPSRGILIAAIPERIRKAVAQQGQRPYVIVGLPVYGGYDPYFVHSKLALSQDPPPGMTLQLVAEVGDSLVSRARNSLAATMLANPKATHLLFIDTDLIFSPEHVGDIVNACQGDRYIVGGYYPKKQRKLDWVLNTLDDEAMFEDGDLAEVKYIGTGFLCIRREVLEKMIETGAAPGFVADGTKRKEHDFFQVGVVRNASHPEGRYCSEDWFFCHNARKLGFRVWGHRRVILKHVGTMIYPVEQPEFDTPSKA